MAVSVKIPTQLRSATEGLSTRLRYKAWQHYWALEYATCLP